ncbi:MAG: hypothetical protein HQL95_03420 [Magnetococcales bacterium]|nr:hypothetical protein [Magnetococcales bacterium]
MIGIRKVASADTILSSDGASNPFFTQESLPLRLFLPVMRERLGEPCGRLIRQACLAAVESFPDALGTG